METKCFIALGVFSVELFMWCPVDIRDYEQWSGDRTSVCACVYEREFEAGLCVARVVDLSGFYEYYNLPTKFQRSALQIGEGSSIYIHYVLLG